MTEKKSNIFFEAIKDKAFFSCFSNEMAEVVEKIPENGETGKVYFDGMFMLDLVEDVEDDIQQVYSYTKRGKVVNMEEYYAQKGAYDNDGGERFIKALSNLMTREQYLAKKKK